MAEPMENKKKNYTPKWVRIQGGYQGKHQKHRIKLE
jgi:hypothetical protein